MLSHDVYVEHFLILILGYVGLNVCYGAIEQNLKFCRNFIVVMFNADYKLNGYAHHSVLVMLALF